MSYNIISVPGGMNRWVSGQLGYNSGYNCVNRSFKYYLECGMSCRLSFGGNDSTTIDIFSIDISVISLVLITVLSGLLLICEWIKLLWKKWPIHLSLSMFVDHTCVGPQTLAL